MFSIKHTKQKWKNWSEVILSQPEATYYPKQADDIIQILQDCQVNQKTLRVVGAGHSFTPLVATSEILLSLEHLSGIETIDHANHIVTVWGGTTLKDLGELLHEQGYAMENLGDINAQSIAGAISTGTHGTGVTFGSLSTQVTQLTVMTASGDIIEVSESSNISYFHAMQLSLGMLGIIIKVHLRVIPSHQLVSESYRASVTDCLHNIQELKENNRHFEFFWFPHTETVQIKQLNRLTDQIVAERKANKFKEVVIENGVFWLLSELCRLQPKLSKHVSALAARGIPTGKEIGFSHSIYATPRLVKFNEMEYSVHAEDMAAVIKDIQYVLMKRKLTVHFPIECRYVQQDDIWLSPSYQRESAYIAVHMYKGMKFKEYFDAVEEVFQHYDGRPHWGKMHTMATKHLREAYPRLDDFLQVRKELDPTGLFLNDYVRNLFSIPT
ncbi:MAG TPA: D-arabinono-1,4-lactone oxidase [Virgibacillus sp.]|nr:D-arabinono-1,4-lactone oxidase [Virgibacillus sp.]